MQIIHGERCVDYLEGLTYEGYPGVATKTDVFYALDSRAFKIASDFASIKTYIDPETPPEDADIIVRTKPGTTLCASIEAVGALAAEAAAVKDVPPPPPPKLLTNEDIELWYTSGVVPAQLRGILTRDVEPEKPEEVGIFYSFPSPSSSSFLFVL